MCSLHAHDHDKLSHMWPYTSDVKPACGLMLPLWAYTTMPHALWMSLDSLTASLSVHIMHAWMLLDGCECIWTPGYRAWYDLYAHVVLCYHSGLMLPCLTHYG
jgi:hypothetical protein